MDGSSDIKMVSTHYESVVLPPAEIMATTRHDQQLSIVAQTDKISTTPEQIMGQMNPGPATRSFLLQNDIRPRGFASIAETALLTPPITPTTNPIGGHPHTIEGDQQNQGSYSQFRTFTPILYTSPSTRATRPDSLGPSNQQTPGNEPEGNTQQPVMRTFSPVEATRRPEKAQRQVIRWRLPTGPGLEKIPSEPTRLTVNDEGLGNQRPGRKHTGRDKEPCSSEMVPNDRREAVTVLENTPREPAPLPIHHEGTGGNEHQRLGKKRMQRDKQLHLEVPNETRVIETDGPRTIPEVNLLTVFHDDWLIKYIASTTLGSSLSYWMTAAEAFQKEFDFRLSHNTLESAWLRIATRLCIESTKNKQPQHQASKAQLEETGHETEADDTEPETNTTELEANSARPEYNSPDYDDLSNPEPECNTDYDEPGNHTDAQGDNSGIEFRQICYTAAELDWLRTYNTQNNIPSRDRKKWGKNYWREVAENFNSTFNQERSVDALRRKTYRLAQDDRANGRQAPPLVEEEEDESSEPEISSAPDDPQKRWTPQHEEWLTRKVLKFRASDGSCPWSKISRLFWEKFGILKSRNCLKLKWRHMQGRYAHRVRKRKQQ